MIWPDRTHPVRHGICMVKLNCMWTHTVPCIYTVPCHLVCQAWYLVPWICVRKGWGDMLVPFAAQKAAVPMDSFFSHHFYTEGYLFLFFFVSFLDVFCFSWLLAFVAFVASVAFGFCGFWLFGLSIYLFVPIYLSIYLSFFLSFGSCSPFSFCICFSGCFRCRDETKQGSKQASKQARAAHLWIWCAAGGGAAPPPNPPRATKSALHPRHPCLPRKQYFKVNSPVQNFLTKQICLLYPSIYLI